MESNTMNTPSNPLLAAVGSSAPARRLLLAAFVAAMLVAALLMTACGGDEPAAPPADSSASAGSAPAPAATAAPATGSTTTGTAPTAAPAGSSAGQTTGASAEPLNVVVGNTVLADLTARVGGDRVSVHNLIPPGSDAHSWRSSPQDSVRIAEAQVIVSNGAELSEAVEQLIENAASSSAVQVITSEGLEPQELLELPFPEDDHHEDEGEAVALEGRLLIGDGETGALSVIDLESGEVHQDEFDLGARAGRIYATASGRYAVAVSSDANAVHLFDGGIYLEEHGDHEDLVEDDLRRLDVDLSGDNPAHLYTAGEWAAIYYDGSGDVVLINEHELEEDGDEYAPVGFNAGPHQGAVVPLDDDLFAVTIPNPSASADPAGSAIGAEIREPDGSVLHRAEGCPDLLGAAGNGHMAVFGCTGGALAVEAHDGDFEDWFIPAPEGSPADFRLTAVYGYAGLDHFYASGSAVGLYLVEPEEGEMEQLIPASDDLRPIQVSISHDGELLVVVMSDGEIRAYDAHDADLLASSSEILSDDVDPGFWARPHVATAPGHVFITDSAAGQVIALEVHGDELEVVESWEISGQPTKIAFVGILGEEGGGHHPEHGHAHTVGDPHFWQNPRLVVHYVNQIANGLVAADPDNTQLYLDNAAAYIEELEALDAYIAETLAGIPHERRVMVTFHDAFGYFATRYDMEVMAFVGGHAGAVSPDDIVRVLDLVNDRGLPAVFAEPQFSADALEQVARDANIAVGHIRSLPDDEYPEYIGMMRANADALAELLQ